LSASSKKQGEWITLFSSCILVTLKFAAGQQTCHPSCAELGLKDSANVILVALTMYVGDFEEVVSRK
jgi:hypothetical protein